MRIPNSAQYDTARRAIARRRLDMAQAQSEIASGRRLETLSSDPGALGPVLRDVSVLASVGARRGSASEAQRLLNETGQSLSLATDGLQRAYEIALQMSNDTWNAGDRQLAASEIAGIEEQILAAANARSGDRYLFGGLANVRPFDAAGGFSGATGKLTVDVGAGTPVDATLPGGGPFWDPAEPSTFQTLDALRAALSGGSGADVRAQLDALGVSLDRVAAARQSAGQAMAGLDGAVAALDRVEDATTAVLAVNRDTDVVDAVVRLREAESGLQAALLMTARMEGLGLVELLGR